MKSSRPLVGIIMGSRSDWPHLRPAQIFLRRQHIPVDIRVISAHRTPRRLYSYARSARSRGLLLIIAAAGGAAHLPGMTASLTPLPVLGVPVPGKTLRGLDAVLSIAQMPAGVPVATFPTGRKGALAAARFAAALLKKIT